MGGSLVLVSMGGTIATRAGVDGLRHVALSGEALAAGIGELVGGVNVEFRDVARLPSRAIGPQHMLHLAETLQAAIDEGCRGIVVTQGTDTMEETAYALALMLPDRVPVAITGAMRPSDQLGADGPANISAAFIAALDARLAPFGPLLAFQEELHLARWVSKRHTSGSAPFRSPGLGPVGWIAEGRVHLLAAPPPHREFLGRPSTINVRVELIEVAAGADGLLVEAAATVSDGIIIAGTGGGHVPPQMIDAITGALERGVVVVLASRTGVGPVLTSTYGGPGSESDLINRGAISAGTLQPLKARLRLMVALSLGMEPRSCFGS
jgi:L-asparaginase